MYNFLLLLIIQWYNMSLLKYICGNACNNMNRFIIIIIIVVVEV